MWVQNPVYQEDKRRVMRYKDIGGIVLLLATMVWLAGCTGSDSDDVQTPDPSTEDIHLSADVWQVMDGTRATTFDNAVALQTEGAFSCAVYEKNTITPFISGTSVNWNTTTGEWLFSDGKHYWPSGALDFFAYMPATPPDYITGPTYTGTPENHTVSFTCSSLPMTQAGQESSSLKEFVYALALDQDKNGTNTTAQPTQGQVSLTFQHPFARIKLQWAASPYDHSSITLTSVKLKGIKNSGTYNSSATPQWTATDDATDLTVTSLAENGAAVPYLVIPQEWTGDIEVIASWTVWGETKKSTLTANVGTTTWEPGTSYTYTFTITDTDLKVDIGKFTEQW